MGNFIYELNEGREIVTIEDFFEFLNRDVKKGTFAYVYYTYPVTVNKTLGDKFNKSKEPNPYYGRIFKHGVYEFRWERTYQEAMLAKDPNFQFKGGTTTYTRVEGVKIIQNGPNGLYLPISPIKFLTPVYSVDYEIVSKEQLASQLPPSRGEFEMPDIMKLLVDRIAGLSAGGGFWKNPDFKFKFMGENSAKFQ